MPLMVNTAGRIGSAVRNPPCVMVGGSASRPTVSFRPGRSGDRPSKRSLRVVLSAIFRGVARAVLGLTAANIAVAAAAPQPDAIVATDGSGQYRSVQEAISAAPMRTGKDDPRWVILVKPGTYHERIYVQRERGNLLVRGEDAATTIITYDLHANLPGPDGQGIGTFRTPTLQVDGDGMIWENLTIANGAGKPGPRAGGPDVAQAVALRVDADRVVFRHCRFLGWQDTILVNRGRQYFADCYIEGSVDFIFGGATAYFDRCHIHCVGDGYVTAASTPEGAPYGLVFSDCSITGARGVRTYLGRPWRNYAQTVFVRTEMSDVVQPAGWHNWKKPEAEKTTFYEEFMSSGPGWVPAQRVPWAKKAATGEVSRYTPQAVLAGSDGWDPAPAPTIHLVGDSTMADKPDLDYPERGWGQLFRDLVRPPWRVVNYAANGRSTKSFRDEGRWDLVLQQLKADDWVLIQFGHNDEKKGDPTRYADPASDYPANLRHFIADVRARGAHPILATPVVRRDWKPDGSLGDTHGAYLAAGREVATAEKVPLLDLEALTRKLETGLGVEGSKKLHMIFAPGGDPHFPTGHTDNTHYVAFGARMVAELAARELARVAPPLAAALAVPAWSPDNGDGTYRNPILHADYSDPDVVRVGDDYWMTSSSFNHVPGLPILHSCDLVNWTLVTHALPRLVPEEAFRTPQHGKGVWAPAIRFHDGRYWIYYPDPDFGIYVVTASDPRGPWSAPALVKAGKGFIDPCPLWDDDGRVWLVHAWAKSRAGINNLLTLQALSADGLRAMGEGKTIIDGGKLPGYTTLEGPKFYKRHGWYYIFAPAGGVTAGWQSVFRSRRIEGPYEDRIVMDQGETSINGPHQGAWVDTPAGVDWFLHFQDQGAYGRVVHLEPMSWHDDWPVIGEDPDGDGRGQPVLIHPKPEVGPALAAGPLAVPATSDEFAAPALGVQWQWQANPDEAWYSLAAAPGRLRLYAQPEPKPGNLYDAPFLLLQKFPAEEFTVTTKLALDAKAEGDCAGLIVFGYDYAWIGLKRAADGVHLVFATRHNAVQGAPEDVQVLTAVPAAAGDLRVTVRAGAKCRFEFISADGEVTIPLRSAGDFTATVGRWVGAKVGVFAAGSAGAKADFAWFRVGPVPREP